jgi:predicted amidophosphoribosyltransferase
VGLALASAMVAVDDRPPPDVVTWVPLARRRLAERGFDQAKVLGVGVARARGIPARALLRRAVATGPQARRGAEERRSAMIGAFGPHRGNGPPLGRVLLVDDVLTTGATASAAALALREQGATAVDLLVAARAFPGPVPGAYTRTGPRSGLWLPGDTPGSRRQPRAKRPT